MKNKKLLATTLALLLIVSCNQANNDLDEILNSDIRVESSERDKFRNPKDTLSFFKINPSQTVVELAPGGGWYTEILAPYLKDHGKLIAAHYNPEQGDYFKRSRDKYDAKLASNEIYKQVEVVHLLESYGENGTADLVLTFRNLHNWIGREDIDTVLSSSYAVLKSGGLFGVVDHRAKPETSLEDMRKSGYMTEAYAIELIEKAGFKLVDSSEVNANPKDTKDHERGVWTLPPSLRLGDQDRDRYLEIGESDRFTLLFQKP
jgi:predicted methyltransferase